MLAENLATRSRFDLHAVLRSRIRLADRLVAELDEQLRSLAPDGYAHQEMAQARNDVAAQRTSAARRLEALPPQAPLDEAAEWRRRVNENLESQTVETRLAFAARLASAGEWRQWRLHLVAVLDVRSRLEEESST